MFDERVREIHGGWYTAALDAVGMLRMDMARHPHEAVGPIQSTMRALRIAEDPNQTLQLLIPSSDPASQESMAELRRLSTPARSSR
jgi:hypothetical protein